MAGLSWIPSPEGKGKHQPMSVPHVGDEVLTSDSNSFTPSFIDFVSLIETLSTPKTIIDATLWCVSNLVQLLPNRVYASRRGGVRCGVCSGGGGLHLRSW